MARKDTVHYPVATAQSMASSFNTPATVITYLDNISYQINITTNNSVGTFAVQASDDYDLYPGGAVRVAGNWINLNLAGGTPFAAAANDNIMIDLNQLPFKAIRIAYTSGTPGTGTCDIILVAKQLGG